MTTNHFGNIVCCYILPLGFFINTCLSLSINTHKNTCPNPFSSFYIIHFSFPIDFFLEDQIQMGAKLCCLNPSSPNQHQEQTKDPRDRVISKCVETVPDEDHTIVFPKEAISSEKVEILTLNDILLASPGRNSHSSPCIITGNDSDMIQHLPNKIFFSPEFFTPRNSFSSGKMWKIDEGEEDELSTPVVSRNRSRKLKTVTFKLPEEADIALVYSKGEALEE